ncbi:hypothetical protein [Methanosphaerula palustris]|uniref:hypothetical protein n=1 Tax=Methanosphaerula palustris TaxID=475088 RepID=UPI00064FFE8E|nr:hypothetical protein [Methanosphaerula palustris]
METFVHRSSEKTATPIGASGHFMNRRVAALRKAPSPAITIRTTSGRITLPHEMICSPPDRTADRAG